MCYFMTKGSALTMLRLGQSDKVMERFPLAAHRWKLGREAAQVRGWAKTNTLTLMLSGCAQGARTTQAKHMNADVDLHTCPGGDPGQTCQRSDVVVRSGCQGDPSQ